MEMNGHPTQDIVDELQRRGALLYPGDAGGPYEETLELARRRGGESGLWLYLPREAYDTEIDEGPPLL